MLSMTVDCGRKVCLDSFDDSHTYAELMEGRPDAEYNAELIERLKTRKEEPWGTSPTRQPPTVANSRLGCQKLALQYEGELRKYAPSCPMQARAVLVTPPDRELTRRC